uniref:hypothetical protein n=1 Tax=Campylobacter jejuni TaxID=197 RepID=UPI00352B94F6
LIVVVGAEAALFLHLFGEAWLFWLKNPSAIWLLPIAGVITVAAHRAFSSPPSTAALLFTLRERKSLTRWFAAPLAIVLTCLSQAFGAAT